MYIYTYVYIHVHTYIIYMYTLQTKTSWSSLGRAVYLRLRLRRVRRANQQRYRSPFSKWGFPTVEGTHFQEPQWPEYKGLNVEKRGWGRFSFHYGKEP